MNERINIDRLLHAVVPFIVMVLLQRFLIIVFGHFMPQSTLGSLLAYLPSVAVAVICMKLIPLSEPQNDTDSVSPLPSSSFPVCIISSSIGTAILITVMTLISSTVFADAEQTPDISLLAFASLVIIHPVTEEYLFRKLIHNDLRLMNPIFASIAQALMFAIVHDTVSGMIYALLAGIVLAVVVEQTGSWLCSLAVHIIINLRSYLYLTVLSEMPTVREAADIVIVSIGAIALISGAVLTGREILGKKVSEPHHTENIGDTGGEKS